MCILVTFHRKAGSGGGRGLPGLLWSFWASPPEVLGSLRLLAQPYRQLQKRSAVLAGGSHPSSPAQHQAQPGSCANPPSGAPGATAWPPRSRARAPEGRGRSEPNSGLRSPTPLAARRLQRPLALPRHPPARDASETPLGKRFSRGFSSEGAGGVSGS